MEEKKVEVPMEEEKKVAKESQAVENHPITNEEFGHIMDIIKRSNASIPLEYVLSILGGIVKDSEKDSEHILDFARLLEGRPTNEVVSSSVLHTCNSVVINIWNLFGGKLEELAKENEAKPESEEVKDVNA